MTEEQFWQIIQSSFEKSEGDMDDQMDALREELEELTPKEVAAFDKQFEVLRLRAYSWDLWGAAYILEGGCSDDGFLDFRTWLISRGKDWFERALKDPDSLAEYPGDLQEGGAMFEEFAYVANEVYEDKTGKVPKHDLAALPQPAGDPFDEDDEESFRSRWPKLFLKYWNS